MVAALTYDEVTRLAGLSKGPVFVAIEGDAYVQVHPQEGQVFCEVDTEIDSEGEGFVEFGSLVQYVGETDVAIVSAEHGVEHGMQHRVACVDHADSDPTDRTPGGMILVRQS